jgi:hypothetical protein
LKAGGEAGPGPGFWPFVKAVLAAETAGETGVDDLTDGQVHLQGCIIQPVSKRLARNRLTVTIEIHIIVS